MAYPESHGSCGGNTGERIMPLMKASSIGFSVLVNSGLAERTKAINPKAIRKRISVVRTSARLDLIKSIMEVLWPANIQTLNPTSKASASNMPPISFCAIPNEANSQKIYPQINSPMVRESVKPRSASAGKSRYANGNVSQCKIVRRIYQARNAVISVMEARTFQQDQAQSPRQKRPLRD